MTTKSPHFQQAGQRYHNFTVTKSMDIAELHCHLTELTHLPTGAKVIHIGNEDPENLFCLSFQTIPTTSNGVAHILEHTVLCGSKKFPVKDPFFAMQRRSLNTFMNALTGSDFTCYPAASQVPQDFYNLLEVYLDAVFHPNLNEYSFLQEGHRLEFAVPDDPNSHLEYKGIVFNEMKGALASPTTRLNEAMNRALFPDLTYGINSGGDPKHIPELSYEELCDFHRTYYHPSRCLFFFYGNLPLEKHLDFIEQQTLKDTTAAPPLPPIPMQPRFSSPKRLTNDYPIASTEDPANKAIIACGWLTCHVLKQEDLLALTILEIALLDTDASPVKMALLKSGLCKQVSCYTEDDISEIPLIITMRGCQPESADALEQVLRDSLSLLAKQGVPLELIENAIHQLEFHRSEISGDSIPFGLSLFMRAALLKQHGGEAEHGLQTHTLFEIIRKHNLEDPLYFSKLIDKYFLNNNHFVRVTLFPSQELTVREQADEQATLAAIQQQLTDRDKEALVAKAAQLVAFQHQQEEEDIEVLPKISLDSVSSVPRTFDLRREKMGNLNVFHHATFTNEIIYADLTFDLAAIPEEELPYVRLLSTLVSQMGCKDRDYAKNLEYIQAHTGGFGASLTFNLQATDHTVCAPSLYLRGKALHRKAEKLFTLLHDMASSVDFSDISRLKEVILKQYTALESSLNQNAMRYAVNLSACGLDIPCSIANSWYGLEYYWTVKHLAQNFDSLATELVERLNHIKQLMLCVGTPDLIVTCDAALYDEIRNRHFYGLQEIKTKTQKGWNLQDYTCEKGYSQGRMISSPVAFTTQVLKTVSFTHPDSPALSIASYLLDNEYLHTSLREKGGAYGGGSVCNPMGGNFYFYAYRDPNIASTLAAFSSAAKEISEGHFDEDALEEAKREMIQGLDSPISPGSRGDVAYGWLREGKTFDIRQTFRHDILHMTRERVVEAVKRQILPGLENSAAVVFAGQSLLDKENKKLIKEGKTPLPIESV